MFEKKPEYSLVLAGGGARGAYEIGAWKALKELGFRFNAVAGASVGALNAAIIAQDDLELGLRIWSEMTLEKVVNVPSSLFKNGRLNLSLKNIRHIQDLNLNLRNLGLDSGPLLRLLQENIKEDRIRKSGIDLGIVTIEIDSLKPCELFLEQIPEGFLPDYLLASASFPAFKRAEINGKQFADGGMYDNIPHRMIKNRGYRNIIVVDISGLGVNRRPDIAGTTTAYIKNSMDLGNILDFNPDSAARAIKLGYLDAMKVYGRNLGDTYFILPDRKTETRLTDLLTKQDVLDRLSPYLELKGRECRPENAATLIRETLPTDQKNRKDLVYCLAEAAAAALGIDRRHEYRFNEFVTLIKDTYIAVRKKNTLPTDAESRSLLDRIGGIFNMFISEWDSKSYSPYEYALALDNHKTSAALYPGLTAAEIFFAMITAGSPE